MFLGLGLYGDMCMQCNKLDNTSVSLSCCHPEQHNVHQAKFGDCDQWDFVWKGNTVRAIDDCGILRKRVKIHLDRLTNKPHCLQQVKVTMFKTESHFSEQSLEAQDLFKLQTNCHEKKGAGHPQFTSQQ